MTTISKRLEKVEQNLSAKELAIRLAIEITKYGSAEEFFNTVNESPQKMEKTLGPWDLIDKQVEAKICGKGNDTERVKWRAYESMSIEFKTLQNLILNINTVIDQRLEKANLEIALHIKSLQTLILQDSFARVAGDTANWIKNAKAENRNNEAKRKILLKELGAHFFDSNGPTENIGSQVNGNDMVKLLNPHYLSQVEDWVFRVKSMIHDIYSHKAAVKSIQDELLNSHSFLFLNTENHMKDVITMIEDTILKHNAYLNIREELLFDQEEKTGSKRPLAGHYTERFNRLKIDIQTLIPTPENIEDMAGKWIANARMEALISLKNKNGATLMELQQIMARN